MAANQIIKKLQLLKSKNEIEEVERGKFKAIINSDYYTGIIEVNAKGSGYIICEAFDDDIYIGSNNLNKALHLDEVEFYVFKRRRNGRLEGEVTQIIKRAKSKTEEIETVTMFLNIDITYLWRVWAIY